MEEGGKKKSILPGNQGMILKILPVSAERRFKGAQTNFGVGRCRQKQCSSELVRAKVLTKDILTQTSKEPRPTETRTEGNSFYSQINKQQGFHFS